MREKPCVFGYESQQLNKKSCFNLVVRFAEALISQVFDLDVMYTIRSTKIYIDGQRSINSTSTPPGLTIPYKYTIYQEPVQRERNCISTFNKIKGKD